MIPRISDYTRIVGKQEIQRIYESAEPLKGRHITHINSTSAGGGVAEILNSHVILMNNLGIKTGWRLLKGSHSFFTVTKRFHNILQGENRKISESMIKLYEEEVEKNAIMNHIDDHDLIIVHDPQPLAMIRHYRKKQPWIWRCHIDISKVRKESWKFFSSYINRYDGIILTMKKYSKKDIKIPKFFITPPLDPLSLKNKHLTKSQCKRILSRNGIDLDKPIICQVSRFDKWKDPLGVVKIFEEVKKKTDCRLVMIGDMATDDPEGPLIYNRLIKKVNNDSGDIHIITKRADLLVNALQRTSDVVIQNSKREGFGMVVSEALWKATPVVAKRRGGIPLQVINNRTGFLVDSNREAAKRIIQLLGNDKLRSRLGHNGKEHVRKNFLITKHIQDYLCLLNLYLTHSKRKRDRALKLLKGMMITTKTFTEKMKRMSLNSRKGLFR